MPTISARTVQALGLGLALAVLDRASRPAFRVRAGDEPERRPRRVCRPSIQSCSAGCAGARSDPSRGGRSQAVAGSASRPLEYYFGATGGGLWKTTDGGVTWRPVSDQRSSRRPRSAPSRSPSRTPTSSTSAWARRSCAATSSRATASTSPTDAGKTWTHVGLEKTQAIARIRVHPTNPDIVYVAALGNPYGPNPERGVFKSTDGGKTWTRVALPRRQDRRRRSLDGSEEPGRALRRAVGGVPHAALAVERRTRQRPLQDDRRRHARGPS